MKIIPSILFFILIAFLPRAGVAQNKFSEEELRNRQKEAYARLKTLSYRMQRVTERYEDMEQPATHRSEVVQFYTPPDSTHTIVRHENRGAVTRTETISVAGTRYVRKNEGEWTRESSASGSGGGSGYGAWGDPQTKPQIETEIASKGKDKVNGVSSNLFVITRKYIFPDKVSTIVEKIWFDEKGLLMRVLSESDGGHPKQFLDRTDTIYNYDPNVRIKAPI